MTYSAAQIAQIVQGIIEGDATVVLRGFGSIESARPGELSFLANTKYESRLYTTEATAVLVSHNFHPTQPLTTTLIRVQDPYQALATLMQLYEQSRKTNQWTGVHATAFVDPSVQIPQECIIGPYCIIEEGCTLGEQVILESHCVVGPHCQIGAHSHLSPHVTLYEGSLIGTHCRLHAGVVIGADGFGFTASDQGYNKIPQIGHVEIGDHVEIGANSCVDRATMGVTQIGSGVKIDNLVQIGHNCRIGDHCVLSAQTGLAGSTIVGSWCQFGGQSGSAGHLTIGDHSQLGGQTGVLGNLESHSRVLGSPAMPIGQALRSYAVLPRLPELSRRLDALEARLAQSESPQ